MQWKENGVNPGAILSCCTAGIFNVLPEKSMGAIRHRNIRVNQR